MTCTVANVKDMLYYEKEEVKQEKTKKGRIDKENYYTESGQSLGFYFGKGAERLGLLNQHIQKGDLVKLANGLHPRTNEKIWDSEKGVKAKSMFTDACLSAPKDFSILKVIDSDNADKYDEIFENASKRALLKMQDKAYRRIRKDGSTNAQSKDVELIQLHFNHETARPTKDKRPDPQVHKHSLTLRKCFTSTGEIKTIDNKFLFTNQKLFGAVFRAELANGLRSMGYEISKVKEEIIDEKGKMKINSFGVVGITDEIRKAFSLRNNEINEKAKQIGMLNNSIAKNFISQNIKRVKEVWDKDELHNIWKSDALQVGLNKEIISGFKKFKQSEFLKNIKLEELIIKQSLTKGKLYESKLMLRLTEYEQYTGIKAENYFNHLKECGAISHKKGFEYSINIKIHNADRDSSFYSRRINNDNQEYGKRFMDYSNSINLKSGIFLNTLLFTVLNLSTDEYKKKFNKSKRIKKKPVEKQANSKIDALGNVLSHNGPIQKRIENMGFTIEELKIKLFDRNLSEEEASYIKAQIRKLAIEIMEEEKKLINLNDEEFKARKFKP